MDTTLSLTETAIADVLRRSRFTDGNDRLILSRQSADELAQQIHTNLSGDGLYIPNIHDRMSDTQAIETIAEQMRPNLDNGTTEFGGNVPVLTIATRIYTWLNAHGLLSNPPRP